MAVSSEGKKDFARLAKKKKFKKVMGEYGKGQLHHGSTGEVVTDPAMARAIAASEARRGKKK